MTDAAFPTRGLAERRKRRLLASSNAVDAFSTQGFDWVLDIIAVVTLSFTASQVGLLNALSSVALVILATPLGALVDTLRPKLALRYCLFLKVCVIAVTLVLLHHGLLNVPTVMVCSFTLAVISIASENAQASYAPLVAQGRSLHSLVANLESVDRVAAIAVPALIGVILPWLGAPYVLSLLFLLAATALALSLFLSPIKDAAQEHPSSSTEQPDSRSSLWQGFREVAKNPTLVQTSSLKAISNVNLAIFSAFESVFVLRTLGIPVSLFGALMTCGAIAGVVSGLCAGAISARFSVKTVVPVAVIIQGCAGFMPLIALNSPSLGLASLLAFQLLWGSSVVIMNVAASAYLAQAVPAAVLGRTYAAQRTIAMGLVPPASILGGLAFDTVGAQPLLIVCPALVLVAGLIVLLRRKTSS